MPLFYQPYFICLFSLGLSEASILAVIKVLGAAHFPEDIIALVPDWHEYVPTLRDMVSEDELQALEQFARALAIKGVPTKPTTALPTPA
ncbi:hypothetical protein EON65_48735, partial [archaeon]